MNPFANLIDNCADGISGELNISVKYFCCAKIGDTRYEVPDLPKIIKIFKMTMTITWRIQNPYARSLGY